jgi:hypothetical protein
VSSKPVVLNIVAHIRLHLLPVFFTDCPHVVESELLETFLYKPDRVCGLVLRVPGYTTQMYCASCEV